MTCDDCGKEMIKRYSGTAQLSSPPSFQWYWWCGCGATKDGGWEREQSDVGRARAAWERANQPAADPST